MNCVADVSFIAGWLLPDEANMATSKLLTAHDAGRVELQVPHLWLYELANLLISAHRRNRLTSEQLLEAQSAYETVRCVFHDQTDPVCRRRILRLAEEHQLTGYDAAYLELADRLRIPMLTKDEA